MFNAMVTLLAQASTVESGVQKASTYLQTKGVDLALKLLGGVALLLVGRWLISLSLALTTRALSMRHIDATISRYLISTLRVALTIALVVAILGFFGVETTSFAALLAAVGIAIGTAWSGMLAHFAAGVFLVILKPFGVGDFISAAGVTGTVREIGLFTTVIDTADNVRTIVANNKLFGDNVQNFSANAYRRVDITAQLSHGDDHKKAIALLTAALEKIPNVSKDVKPDVLLATFSERGPVLAVRPYTHNDHYWQVFFDTNTAIREELGAAGFQIPEAHTAMRAVTR